MDGQNDRSSTVALAAHALTVVRSPFRDTHGNTFAAHDLHTTHFVTCVGICSSLK